MRITKKAYAKINLTLCVLGKRDDGYHNIVSVMQSVSLCDYVTIQKNTGGVNVSWSLPEKPDENNTAYKAASLMIELYKISGGVDIQIQKNIPVSAGLGGGSADAAAVIESINELYALGLDTNALLCAGKEIGADVPFCILKGAALAEGIGERLTRISSNAKCHVVLAKPLFNVSTKESYGKLDKAYSGRSERAGIRCSDNVANALKEADINMLCRYLCNDFEAEAESEHPIITELKRKLIVAGAVGALMSGSGPTVYGLFEDAATAENARAEIEKKYGLKAVNCTFCN